MSDASGDLTHGEKYPYDCDNNGEAEPSPDWAHFAARGVVANLRGRRGIKWSFEEIEEDDTRKEIVECLASIIRQAHGEKG
ncbi:hypothetical protein GCM10008171_33320 [Methylopila jiangsuensis]|uniref:Uncharacterized protein n=1 Tax=Methylopila jiangsuensis TaxID=586230 RepID=A0A9W6JKX9_9HYPH|nr:hypothetical protein [Methylopila jiangsuensis]MDR6284534.1 hypothetical protein [Methylopila jiangsuensis]GLK78078.1 hypothetical protein GCM10008171_33320 [Methylopila jiangsuensis]